MTIFGGGTREMAPFARRNFGGHFGSILGIPLFSTTYRIAMEWHANCLTVASREVFQ